MTTRVYIFPADWCIITDSFTHMQPISVSRSFLSNKTYKTIFGPERVKASVSVDGSIVDKDGVRIFTNPQELSGKS